MTSYRVIDYLQKHHIAQYYVFVWATSNISSLSIPINILNWNSVYIYHSANKENQYIRLDFPLSNVFIESFSIRTAVNRDPYNWVFDASRNATNFDILYENKAQKLCEWAKFDGVNTGCVKNEVRNFSVSSTNLYKSFRLRQTGNDSNGENYLIVNSIEIIGRITIIHISLKCKRYSFFMYLYIISFSI